MTDASAPPGNDTPASSATPESTTPEALIVEVGKTLQQIGRTDLTESALGSSQSTSSMPCRVCRCHGLAVVRGDPTSHRNDLIGRERRTSLEEPGRLPVTAVSEFLTITDIDRVRSLRQREVAVT